MNSTERFVYLLVLLYMSFVSEGWAQRVIGTITDIKGDSVYVDNERITSDKDLIESNYIETKTGSTATINIDYIPLPFIIDNSHMTALNDENKEDVQKFFKTYYVSLSKDIDVTAKPPDKKWVIIDKKNEIQLSIRKEGAELKTYWESNIGCTKEVKENSKLKLEKVFRQELSISDFFGEVLIDSKGVYLSINEKNNNNTTIRRTKFRITSRDEGTVVDVMRGEVELKREGEKNGTRVIRDHKAMISKDQTLRVISPRPYKIQLLLTIPIPGTNRIYARSDPLYITEYKGISPYVTSLISTTAAIGWFVSYKSKINHKNASSLAYKDYENEYITKDIEEFYSRHKAEIGKTNKYRQRRNWFGAVWIGVLCYELYATWKENKEIEENINTIDEIEKKIRDSSKKQGKFDNTEIDFQLHNDKIFASMNWSW